MVLLVVVGFPGCHMHASTALPKDLGLVLGSMESEMHLPRSWRNAIACDSINKTYTRLSRRVQEAAEKCSDWLDCGHRSAFL